MYSVHVLSQYMHCPTIHSVPRYFKGPLGYGLPLKRGDTVSSLLDHRSKISLCSFHFFKVIGKHKLIASSMQKILFSDINNYQNNIKYPKIND